MVSACESNSQRPCTEVRADRVYAVEVAAARRDDDRSWDIFMVVAVW